MALHAPRGPVTYGAARSSLAGDCFAPSTLQVEGGWSPKNSTLMAISHNYAACFPVAPTEKQAVYSKIGKYMIGRNRKALTVRLYAFLGALAVIFATAVVVHPPTAKADETNGYGEAVTGWTAITPEGAPAKPNAQGQLEGQLVATRDGKQGYGWCIDFGIHNPTKAPKNIKYTGPVRLTHVKPLYTREIAQVFNYGDKQETARGVDLNQDKDRRNVMIHLVKELKKAQKRGDTERASKLARSLQLVSASFYETNKQALQYTYNGVRQYGWNLNNAEFEQLTGYKVAKGEDSQYFLEHTGKANPPIPEAAPDEYLTIISPTEYRLDKVRPSEAQRLITIDQPGLKIGPEIGTKAAFKGENHQVKAGAVITDTVSYKKPGGRQGIHAEREARRQEGRLPRSRRGN